MAFSLCDGNQCKPAQQEGVPFMNNCLLLLRLSPTLRRTTTGMGTHRFGQGEKTGGIDIRHSKAIIHKKREAMFIRQLAERRPPLRPWPPSPGKRLFSSKFNSKINPRFVHLPTRLKCHYYSIFFLYLVARHTLDDYLISTINNVRKMKKVTDIRSCCYYSQC